MAIKKYYKERPQKVNTASKRTTPKKTEEGKQPNSRASSEALDPRLIAKIRHLIREELTRAKLKKPKSKVHPRPPIDPNLLSDVGDFVDDPERWFLTPNFEFEGRAPIELLGTPEEARLRNRIEASKFGMFS